MRHWENRDNTGYGGIGTAVVCGVQELPPPPKRRKIEGSLGHNRETSTSITDGRLNVFKRRFRRSFDPETIEKDSQVIPDNLTIA